MAHTGSGGEEEPVGPTSAVAARDGIGLRSPEALRIRRPAGAPDPTVHTLAPARAASSACSHGQDLAGHIVRPDDELSWAWFPEHCLPPGVIEPSASDLDRFWDATAFSLDIVFDDGSRLSEQAFDQYGVALTPAAQEEARMQWVDQWNLRRVDLSGCAGLTVTRVEAVLGTAGDGAGPAPLPLTGWLDAVRIRPAAPKTDTPLDFVRTTRGTHSSDRFSRGNNAPLVAVPHGGVFGLPMTDASDARWPYSYHAHVGDDARPRIQAFATSHIPSPWMGDRGVFQVMPSPSAHPDTDRSRRALAFDHDVEVDRPDEYTVRLEQGVTAWMTASDFALGIRFEFAHRPAPSTDETPHPERAAVILDHHGTVDAASVTIRDGVALVDAHLDDRAETPPHYIHARISGAVTDQTRYTPPGEDGDSPGTLGGWITVDATSPVDVLIGISTVSAEDAEANLQAAIGDGSKPDGGDDHARHDRGRSTGYDIMRADAERRWQEALGTLRVEGATDDQLVSLFSGLYRLFLYPNRAAETARDGTPRHRSPYAGVLEHPIRTDDAEEHTEIVEGPFTTTNGFWDTYRTAWPLLGLLTPERAGELATGFVRHAADGGWMPRWSAPGAEDVMTGTTSDTVFADLLVKGVPGLDLEAAYRTALKNATVPSPDPRVGRKGLLPGVFRGYVDTDTPEGMSWTLDAAINDWGIAVMARMLRDRSRAEGDTDAAERYDAEYEWFARRSLLYREVFDPHTGFFRGRLPDGSWREDANRFDPDQWGHDYTETNAWGTMFTVPHDGAGLTALHGGEQGLRKAFDRFSSARETGSSDRSGSYGFAIHEMTEARDIRMGTLGMSNQPAHHIPFIPMFSGDHDRSHAIVRECLQRLFVGSDLGQGYPGDEDNGEMSAWYVFATIGLYPLAPATGSYVLVPPSVRRSVLQVPGGTTVIEIDGPCRGPYVSAVTVDGEPWDDITIPHEMVTRGANIVFTLSESPQGWARHSRPVSASDLHGFADAPRDLLPSVTDDGPRADAHDEADAASALTDDTGATRVFLHAGQSIDIPARPEAASLYTVTVADPTRASWTVALVDADGPASQGNQGNQAAQASQETEASRVVAEDAHRDEPFDWPEQTRVFRLTGPAASRPAETGAASTASAPSRTFRFTADSPMVLTQLELIAASSSVGDPDSPESPDRTDGDTV